MHAAKPPTPCQAPPEQQSPDTESSSQESVSPARAEALEKRLQMQQRLEELTKVWLMGKGTKGVLPMRPWLLG